MRPLNYQITNIGVYRTWIKCCMSLWVLDGLSKHKAQPKAIWAHIGPDQVLYTFHRTTSSSTASKISSFIKFTAESRHNRSRGTDQCDNNIIVDTAYCNVVSFNKIFAFHWEHNWLKVNKHKTFDHDNDDDVHDTSISCSCYCTCWWTWSLSSVSVMSQFLHSYDWDSTFWTNALTCVMLHLLMSLERLHRLEHCLT